VTTSVVAIAFALRLAGYRIDIGKDRPEQRNAMYIGGGLIVLILIIIVVVLLLR
jgi:hypothetical protein